MAKQSKRAKCGCREPKRHPDCLYCGSGYAEVCGQCRDVGIDGPVVRGTSRVQCRTHHDGRKPFVYRINS